MDNLYFTIVCAAVGAVAGFFGGLLGIGGGVIIVPALIILFDAIGLESLGGPPGNGTTLVAVGTSLASIVFTSISSARSHHARGSVEWSVVCRMAPALVVGALAGATASSHISSAVPKIAFLGYCIWLTYLLITKIGSSRMAIVDLPMGIVYGVVMFGFALMTLRAAQVAWGNWKRGYSVLERPDLADAAGTPGGDGAR